MADEHPIKKVAIPSRIKIQRQPARPPMPSIFKIAVASKPSQMSTMVISQNKSSSCKLTTKGTGQRSYVLVSLPVVYVALRDCAYQMHRKRPH